jgi:hydrogenase nickel incorporation protein HypA/HybF
MQAALGIAAGHACRRGATRIHRLTLRVGRLAGIEPVALVFAFDALAAGTPAEGACLEVETVPTVCYCRGCAAKFEPADFIYACQCCGVLSTDIRGGQELELASLEVSSSRSGGTPTRRSPPKSRRASTRLACFYRRRRCTSCCSSA